MADEKLVEAVSKELAVMVLFPLAENTPANQAREILNKLSRRVIDMVTGAALSPSVLEQKPSSHNVPDYSGGTIVQPAAPEQESGIKVLFDCLKCGKRHGIAEECKRPLTADVERLFRDTNIVMKAALSNKGHLTTADIDLCLDKLRSRLSSLLPAPVTAEKLAEWLKNHPSSTYVHWSDFAEALLKAFPALRSEPPAELPSAREMSDKLASCGNNWHEFRDWLSPRCQPRQRLTREQLANVIKDVMDSRRQVIDHVPYFLFEDIEALPKLIADAVLALQTSEKKG